MMSGLIRRRSGPARAAHGQHKAESGVVDVLGWTAMDTDEKIRRLEEYRANVLEWRRTDDPAVRSYINQNIMWARREVIEAGCYVTLTIGPPPITGGLVMRNIDPFEMMFDPPYNKDLVPVVVDMLDRAIGVLRSAPPDRPEPKVQLDVTTKGYAFIAMPMDADDPQLVDVLDAIKEAAGRCGLQAERVDEPQYTERITDRVLESIRKAEYVIVDLTNSKPNVFYEAGYAQGRGKTPIYIARHGTKLEFDLKDYPVIFFKNMKALKDALELRLRGLAENRSSALRSRRAAR